MIYIDQNFEAYFNGKTRTFRHLISDNGTEELLKFGGKIGLNKSWLQKRGKHDEHFDLFGIKIELAIKNGAIEKSFREFVGILKIKRLKILEAE